MIPAYGICHIRSDALPAVVNLPYVFESEPLPVFLFLSFAVEDYVLADRPQVIFFLFSKKMGYFAEEIICN